MIEYGTIIRIDYLRRCEHMAIQVAAEQMKEYKRTARARAQADEQRLSARRERAWQLAHQAAAKLKTEYHAQRVVAFGSLTQADRFNRWSDVDIAAWGLTSANWLRAGAAVASLSGDSGIEINLVDVECCSPELLAAIERDGVTI